MIDAHVWVAEWDDAEVEDGGRLAFLHREEAQKWVEHSVEGEVEWERMDEYGDPRWTFVNGVGETGEVFPVYLHSDDESGDAE